MSDNKLNQENVPGGNDDAQKTDMADISFKKPGSVSRKNNEQKPLAGAEISDKSKAVNEKKDVNKPVVEIKSEKQSSPSKAVPDLNLKGIKVDLADDSSEVKAEPTVKKTVKKTVEKPINKPVKVDLPKQSTAKPEKKQNENKPDSKKQDDKKIDSTDGQKTMVMKDTSSTDKSDKKAYIKSDVKAAAPKNKKKKKKKNQSSFNNSIFGGFFLAFGIVVAAFIVAIGGISLGKEYLGIDKAENDITFNIPQGSTSADIAEMLEENQIISNKLLFRLALKLNAPDTIYPGDITLQPAMGYSAIIEQLGTMRESYETATISFPEGVTLLEVAQLLEEQGVCKADEFLFEFNKSQGYDFENLISGNEDAFYHMEGYFFPDTYDFYLNDTGYNITKIVREHFSQKFTDKMTDKMEKSKLTLNEVMILASMVQWESVSYPH
ncbi:MAG: endolytic transglycosylase MltG, partial [Ruminococcus sp.]|nr:endolytic transglycosylase MltG [Ruminococcus sp.]